MSRYSSLSLCIFLSLSVTAQYRAPVHDVRIGLDFRVIQDAASRFGDVYYGDALRMAEFGCGDPAFHINITKAPKLTLSSLYQSTDSTYWASVNLQARAHAQIDGNCFGHPPAEADIGGEVSLREYPGDKNIPVHGNVNIYALEFGPGYHIFQRSFGIDLKVPIPTTVDSALDVTLESRGGFDFDFGELVEGHAWKSTGTRKHLNVQIRTFSLDHQNGSDTRFVVDGSIGSPRYDSFSDFSKIYEYLRSDDPIIDEGTVGVSVSDTFFGSASADGAGYGLLRELLPIRAVAEKEFRFGSCTMRKRFEIVFTTGQTTIDHDADGKGTVKINLGSTFARVNTVGDDPQSASKLLRGAVGSVTLDRIELLDDKVQFRISDFRIDVNAGGHLIPIRLSAGDLQKAVNGGAIPIGTIDRQFAFQIPECIPTDYDKTKAAHDCPEPGGFRDGWLSQTKGTTRIAFKVDLAGARLKFEPHRVRFSLPVVIDHVDHHP